MNRKEVCLIWLVINVMTETPEVSLKDCLLLMDLPSPVISPHFPEIQDLQQVEVEVDTDFVNTSRINIYHVWHF